MDIKQYSTGRDKIARKDEIKVYNEKEDIVADYENFRKDWEYDRDEESGTHKSRLEISKVFMNGLKFQFPNLPQWMTEMKEGGMTREEAERAECWKIFDEQLNSSRLTRAQPHPKNMYCATDNGLSWSQQKNYNITANDYEPDMEEEKQQVFEKKEHEEEKYCNFHWSQHPDGGYRDYVSFMYGEDFLEQMYNEAKSRAVDMSAEMAKPLNIEDKGQYLYSGRSFAIEPQTILARNNMESRCGVYATPSL